MDNTHIRRSFYTVYSQPNISYVSSSRKRSLRLVETAEIQASLQSPLFSRLVEDGDGRCQRDLIWASPVTLHFFPLSVLKRCSPYISSPSLKFIKTLKGLLMRLGIFVNTVFQLNSLNITVSVCYVSGSNVNRKERSRPSVFVCLFLCSTLLIYQSRSIWFRRASVMSGVWNGQRKSVWISMITGITTWTAPPIKVLVPSLDHYFILRNSRLFACLFVCFL